MSVLSVPLVGVHWWASLAAASDHYPSVVRLSQGCSGRVALSIARSVTSAVAGHATIVESAGDPGGSA
jgi:hypothetical protein